MKGEASEGGEKSKSKVPTSVVKRPTKVRTRNMLTSQVTVSSVYLPIAYFNTQKKPKDKPKRPLSAYNFFFKEEREKILKIVLAEDPEKVENEPDTEDYINDDTMGRLKKEGGKVSFEEMGKLIGQRWKNIDPDRLAKYAELASEDTERYKNEMQTYNGRQEAKMRSEALKPPVTFPGAAARLPEHFPGGPQGAPGMEASGRAPAGYPEQMANMSAFANPAAGAAAGGGYNPYGGMEFGGYGGMGMGAYGMAAYGGYGMGGAQEAAMGMGGGMDGAAAAYGRGGGMDGAAAYGRGVGGGYGAAMGMMGGGFQGGMMGYGGGGADAYGGGHPMDQHGAGGPHGGMYGGGGYGGQGWGGQ